MKEVVYCKRFHCGKIMKINMANNNNLNTNASVIRRKYDETSGSRLTENSVKM